MAERPDARNACGAPQQATVFIWPGFFFSLASADAFNHRVRSAAAFLVINLQLLLHARAEKNKKQQQVVWPSPVHTTFPASLFRPTHLFP